MKKTLITLLAVGLLALVLVALAGMYKFNYLASQPGYDVDGNKIEAPQSAADYKNTTYQIAGESVTLTEGVSEVEAAPGSASKITTQYFGNEVRTDLNADGREDVVFLLTQSTGGSGTFFYAVAAVDTGEGWVGSDAFLLGDRIAPQTTEVSQDPNHQNVIVVNYADRAAGEPMTAQPSVGKSVLLKLDAESMTLGTVEQNFAGEADPEVMTLDMKEWTWVRTTYNDDTEIIPNDPEAFTLTFSNDSSVSIKTDCNTMGGSYTVEENQITFGPMFSTKMFCQDSQEQLFSEILSEVQSYFFTSRGELIFELKFDTGSMVFR